MEAGIQNKEIQNDRFTKHLTKDARARAHTRTPVISSPFYAPRKSALQKALLRKRAGILTSQCSHVHIYKH